MILSHKYKYIFIKTNKTAGTSIEIALSKYCGDTDIVTPMAINDEELRKISGYPGSRNYFVSLKHYDIVDIGRLILQFKRKKYFNHISGKEIRTIVGEEVWNSYYKFCFERNPWDRVVSLYYWYYKECPRPTFSDYVASNIPFILKKRGYDLYTINNMIAVDKIYRYEDLNGSMRDIAAKLNLPEVPELPMTKSSFRVDRRDYRQMYNREDAEKIAKMFEREISIMGYKYDHGAES